MLLCFELINVFVLLFDEVEVFDELGCVCSVFIFGECLFIVYFDKCELVMLMMLGGVLEVFVFGYLCN